MYVKNMCHKQGSKPKQIWYVLVFKAFDQVLALVLYRYLLMLFIS